MSKPHSTMAGATLIGASAIVLWGGLALLTTWSGVVPPFQLVAMTFTIGFGLMAVKWLIRGENPRRYLRHPPAVWLLGIAGLFGYHALYFLALRNAPAVEASLIAYLWPLLIVLFSNLLPGERLRWYHLAGTGLGLAGCALLLSGGEGLNFKSQYALGYGAAAACALTWSIYSVASRKFGTVPTDVVGWFCAATAVLGLACHLIWETTVWPDQPGQWLAIGALGLGPVGLAFFTWDIGVKHGNIKVLGALAYFAPLLSALLLLAFGQATASWSLALACLGITGGALLAAKDMWVRGR